MYRSLQFYERSKHLTAADDETLSVVMRVYNPDCSPFAVNAVARTDRSTHAPVVDFAGIRIHTEPDPRARGRSELGPDPRKRAKETHRPPPTNSRRCTCLAPPICLSSVFISSR